MGFFVGEEGVCKDVGFVCVDGIFVDYVEVGFGVVGYFFKGDGNICKLVDGLGEVVCCKGCVFGMGKCFGINDIVEFCFGSLVWYLVFW